MGAGNWSARSRYFETSVVYVDELLESFEDYRQRAEQEFKRWLVENHPSTTVLQLLGEIPGAVEEFSGSIIDWAKENHLQGYLDEALGEEFPLWDSPETFAVEESADRLDLLLESTSGSLAQALPKVLVNRGALKHRQFWSDPNAMVLAEARYAQVALRHWEGNLYFAVAPKNDVENQGPFLTREHKAEICEFLGRCWAACDPQNKEFSRYSNSARGPAPVELRPTEAGRIHDGKVDSILLDAVVARAVAQATQLEASGDEAGIQAFTDAFGIEPSYLVHAERTSDLAVHLECVEELDATPQMVMDSYTHESRALENALLNSLARDGEKPMRPDTAWTSKAVDLSNYRHVVAVQVGPEQIEKLMHAPSLPSELLSGPRMSVMRENVFDRTVAGAVQNVYPHVADVHGDIMKLHLRSAGDTVGGGVFVWRGHLDWLAQNVQGTSDLWLREQGSTRLGELPVWMSLQTDSGAVRDVLDSVAAPASIAKNFFTEDGSLDVTGVMVETRDGDYGTVYVTYDSRPHSLSARYEAVLLNGTWNMPTAPAVELSHE